MKIVYLKTGSFLLLLGVFLGAFAAHGLKDKLPADSLMSFDTGTRYMIYHGLAMLCLGTLSLNKNKTNLFFYRFLLIGVSLFSGSIFLLSTKSLTGIHVSFLVPITPTGGFIIIICWAYFAFKLNKILETN